MGRRLCPFNVNPIHTLTGFLWKNTRLLRVDYGTWRTSLPLLCTPTLTLATIFDSQPRGWTATNTPFSGSVLSHILLCIWLRRDFNNFNADIQADIWSHRRLTKQSLLVQTTARSWNHYTIPFGGMRIEKTRRPERTRYTKSSLQRVFIYSAPLFSSLAFRSRFL